MKVSQLFTYLTIACAVHAVSIPDSKDALSVRHEDPADVLRSDQTLEKRKGGGGRGGGGGGGGGRGGGGRSGGGGAPAGTSRTSNVGGATRSGSGPARTYGGGGYYGGGAVVPYQAGKKSTKGLAAGGLLGAGVALAIMPGLWLWSVYPYHFNNPYRFVNETLQNETNPNGVNQTLPVLCLCQRFAVCGCDENDDRRYLDDLVGNGSYPALNDSLVTVSDVNDTRTLVINGTLPNGTTAPGGDDGAGTTLALQYSGYWVMALLVVYTAAWL